ncbi:MAG TPA: tetratricopeptide repeat protein [Methylomirabilota bacterium]|nr:tetratricopeptide repeat protein [Methylomirabilota bacterium]
MSGRTGRWLLVAIAAATFLLFLPSLRNGFVDWDDNLNFTRNPYYRGLGWAQLRWMAGATVTTHWIPVTWLTLGLDYVLWGMNPAGYHLTNVVLHALNAVLFALTAYRLLERARPRSDPATLRAGAAVAALFFALHPLRVETVAWVTERRGLLSACFALVTVLTYLRMCEAAAGARWRWLAASVGAYALALLSQASVVPLPVVLLVLDAYPLGRLGPHWRAWTAADARRVWLEKLPYVALAAGAATIALAVNHAQAVSAPIASFPPAARVAMLAHALVFYIVKTFMPLALNPLYELPERVSPLAPEFAGALVAVLAVTGGLWLLRRRWPAGLALWGAYALVLVPVSGLFQTGHQLVADRYTYLSCLSWALAIGGGVCAARDAAAAGRLRAPLAAGVAGIAALWLAGLAALTLLQVEVWRNTETLWRYALELDPACALCYSQLGAELGNRGELERAVEQLEQGVALRPGDAVLHGNLGLTLFKLGRFTEAVPHTEQALAARPADVATRVRLGVALLASGRAAEGIAQLRQAVVLGPRDAGARYELARAYLTLGHRAAAREQLDVLRRLDPALARELE